MDKAKGGRNLLVTLQKLFAQLDRVEAEILKVLVRDSLTRRDLSELAGKRRRREQIEKSISQLLRKVTARGEGKVSSKFA